MNMVSGNIPEALGSIQNLQGLYLAVAGNVNLCGGTPQLHLAPCPTSDLIKNKRKLPKSLVISLAIAGAILFSLSVILLGWISCKKLRIIAEYGEGVVVSTAGDIYSLGILLLEMFTGRSPTEGTFRDSLDLHKFVEDALLDRTFEMADPTISLHGGRHGNSASIGIQECLVLVFRLGIS